MGVELQNLSKKPVTIPVNTPLCTLHHVQVTCAVMWAQGGVDPLPDGFLKLSIWLRLA